MKKSSMIFFTFFLFCVITNTMHSISINEQPIFCKNIPNYKDIYENYIGNRPRAATLSGVDWFHDDYLGMVSNADAMFFSYFFDRTNKTLTPLQAINNEQGADLSNPIDLTFSPDGSLVAIASSNKNITIHRVDLNSHMVSPIPIINLNSPKTFHGISFSSSGNYLAVTEIGNPGLILIYRIEKEDPQNYNLVLSQTIQNKYRPKKPKGIHFSSDDAYIAIVYGSNALSKPNNANAGLITIHTFNQITGTISPPLCSRTKGICVPEDVRFFDGDSHIIISNQGNDTEVIYQFDKATAQLSNNFLTLKNPSAQLDFPHGVAVSHDSKYIAVANMSPHICNIYEIKSE